MKKNEGKLIILIIALLIIVIAIMVILLNGKKDEGKEEGQKNTANEEKYTVELEDGTKINTSEEFNSTKKYGTLEISNIQYTEKNGKTVLLADVTNTGNTRHETEIVKIDIIGKDGEIITTTKPVIGNIEPGDTVRINATITADVSNAKDFTITGIK